jgi:trimeric autotransporter adhesin
MSTKTTFKRIALVAVAALGLGVLSVAPSQAALTDGTLTWSVANGTAAPGKTDSTTAAIISVEGLLTSVSDTITVRFISKGAAPTAVTNYTTPRNAFLSILDTATANAASTTKVGAPLALGSSAAGSDSFTGRWSPTTNGVETTTAGSFNVRTTSAGYAGARFNVQLESVAAPMYGTYTYSALVTVYSLSGTGSATSTEFSKDFSITVATPANLGQTVASASSTAFINAGTGTTATADAVVTAVATAASTVHATIPVRTYNSGGGAAPESITASISGAGTLCSGGVCGSSLVLAGTGTTDLTVLANGTAGVATIKVSTPTVTFADKTVTFYAKAAKTLTAAVYNPVLRVGANSTAVAVTAVDAAGTNWAGAAYIVASAAADALVGGSATTPVACAYSSADKTHFCPVTTIATGTAKFKVIDASTVALATATSNEVTVTVSNASAASVKLAFDKASYAPFEKALVTVTVLDKDGKALQGARYSDALAAGGITSTYAFGSGSDTLTGTVINTAEANGTSTTAGAQTFTVYMPGSGDVTISATGGSSLAAAGQVKVTATASVVNSSVDAATDAANEATDAANAATDAALAAADAADAATAAAQDASDAVAALSASVSKLISSLRAQITSLTNLVIKIQKKVRA